jgi:hypothetical protein
MPTNTQVQTFTNNQGRTFAVRLLPTGARYGRRNCVTNDSIALVEFYDTTYADDTTDDDLDGGAFGFGPLGQFVARYHVTTLLRLDEYRALFPGPGLCLDGGNAEVWTIDADTMTQVERWLSERVTVTATHWLVVYNPVAATGIITHQTHPGRVVAFSATGPDATFSVNDALPHDVIVTVSRWIERTRQAPTS